MHRQSLGSPASKLHIHGLAGVREEKSSSNLTVQVSPTRFSQSTSSAAADEDEERKSIKPQKSIAKQLIHLIPLLTLVCFLILYLSSHDPSQKDLAQFDGLKFFSKPIDSSNIDDIGRILEIERSDVLAIRNLRNLQEVDTGRHRLHRKIGGF